MRQTNQNRYFTFLNRFLRGNFTRVVYFYIYIVPVWVMANLEISAYHSV